MIYPLMLLPLHPQTEKFWQPQLQSDLKAWLKHLFHTIGFCNNSMTLIPLNSQILQWMLSTNIPEHTATVQTIVPTTKTHVEPAHMNSTSN